MKEAVVAAFIDQCRSCVTTVIAEDANLRVIVAANGEASVVGTYKLIGEFGAAGGGSVTSLLFILDEADSHGNIIGIRSQSVAMCCGCSSAAEKSVLLKCKRCSRYFHEECGKMVGDDFYCPAHAPSLIRRVVGGLAKWIAKPFVEIK